MRTKKSVRFGDIVHLFDMTDDCTIWQEDVYISKDKPEIIYEGSIMEIPWYILDFYLTPDKDGEPIGVRYVYDNDILTGRVQFVFSVTEEKPVGEVRCDG